MRKTTRGLVEHYVRELDLKGDVLEVGGFRLAQCAINDFAQPRFRYHSLDLDTSDGDNAHGQDVTISDIPNTVFADITDCREQVPDESYDIVFSSDVFEHIDRPWLAAAEIARILRPGGIAITWTLWSWRNHPCPIDYWRYSAECLAFLFGELECLEKGYDLSERRRDQPGFWADGADSVPLDGLGGWREHWAVYCVNRKGAGPVVTPFKETDHRLAMHLRRDTQGTVTNPRMLGAPNPVDALALSTQLGELEKRMASLTDQLEGLQSEAERRAEQRHRRLDRRVIGMGQPLPLRAYRKLRRRAVE